MASAGPFEVQIYYEDTDHSGRVYHANYLKYFERAREHLFGVQQLKRLWEERGLGFVVTHAELTYKAGAVFGDCVRLPIEYELLSDYRAKFHQRAERASDGTLLVEGSVTMVLLDSEGNLKPLKAAPEILSFFEGLLGLLGAFLGRYAGGRVYVKTYVKTALGGLGL